MLRFEQITSPAHRYWPFLIECYRQSFPPDERRPVDRLAAMLQKESFACNLLLRADIPVGLFNCWHFGWFRYIEHFAVQKQFRDMHIGSEALTLFLEESNVPVIIEVEPPESGEAIKRIRFYERSGFVLNVAEYIQPAYTEQRNPVVMRLMEWGGRLLENDGEKVKKQLYRAVYHR